LREGIEDMDTCCEAKAEELSALRGEQKKVLTIVLVINAVLFFVEAGAGLLAQSTALLADSLDMLGDALVYGFSLYVLWRSAELKALAAMLKGVVMAVFGFGVLSEAVYKAMVGVIPSAETMGIIGLLVLVGNGLCFFLLLRHRADDINMRSTWLCSRNDIVANCAVLVAAGGVAFFQSIWPDVVTGAVIAFLFLRTAFGVLTDSIQQYRMLQLHPRT
jgi:cation diffusion facilitator family transporter